MVVLPETPSTADISRSAGRGEKERDKGVRDEERG
jgi:hypothetical protein